MTFARKAALLAIYAFRATVAVVEIDDRHLG